MLLAPGFTSDAAPSEAGAFPAGLFYFMAGASSIMRTPDSAGRTGF